MRTPYAFIIFLLAALPAQAAEEPVPIVIQYERTGRENMEQSEALGAQEKADGNPCVTRMERELEKLAKSKEMGEAVSGLLKTHGKNKKLKPKLVLFYVNESMELRFELIEGNIRDNMGFIVKPAGAIYRKAVVLSPMPGTWRDRIKAGQCTVTESSVKALVDELREADRLDACVARKMELLEASRTVRNYIHNYMPVNWIDEARTALARKSVESSILREDPSAYRAGNSTYRECSRSLKLLEDEATASVHVLQEVRATKLDNQDIPVAALEELERKLKKSESAK